MLWLLRHAEAAEGRPDEARPLTPRGIEQARIAGLALARLGVTIDNCLSSPKRRAIETAELACEPLGVEVTIEPALGGEPFDVREVTAGLGFFLRTSKCKRSPYSRNFSAKMSPLRHSTIARAKCGTL